MGGGLPGLENGMLHGKRIAGGGEEPAGEGGYARGLGGGVDDVGPLGAARVQAPPGDLEPRQRECRMLLARRRGRPVESRPGQAGGSGGRERGLAGVVAGGVYHFFHYTGPGGQRDAGGKLDFAEMAECVRFRPGGERKPLGEERFAAAELRQPRRAVLRSPRVIDLARWR